MSGDYFESITPLSIKRPTSFPGSSPTRPTLSRSVGPVGENPGNEVVKGLEVMSETTSAGTSETLT